MPANPEQSLTPCGTHSYWAPEMEKSNVGDYGESVDIYSLGMIVFELLKKKLPSYKLREGTRVLLVFSARARSGFMFISVPIRKVLRGKLWNAGFNLSLTLFLQGTLQEDPKKRPTASELLDHPFVKRENFLRTCKDLKKMITSTASTFVTLSNVGSMHAVDPFHLAGAKSSLDVPKRDHARVLCLASCSDAIAVGYSDGMVLVWEIDGDGNLGRKKPVSGKMHLSGVYWIGLTASLVVSMDAGGTLIARSRRSLFDWSPDVSSRTWWQHAPVNLEDAPDGADFPKGVLTFAVRNVVHQYNLAEYMDGLSGTPRSGGGKEGVPIATPEDRTIRCIAPSFKDTHLYKVWVATEEPKSSILLVDLKAGGDVLAKIQAPHTVFQMLDMGDLLLCRLCYSAAFSYHNVAYDLRGYRKGENDELKEDFWQFGSDNSESNMHCLNGRHVVFTSGNQLQLTSVEEILDMGEKTSEVNWSS